MKNQQNLRTLAFSTIAIQFVFLLFSNSVSSIFKNNFSSFISVLFTINYIFLFLFLRKNENIKSYPIILISLATLLIIIDTFIPYQSIKTDLEVTNLQAGFIDIVRYVFTGFLHFLGELTFILILLKIGINSIKKLGLWLIISLLINTFIPISFSFLPMSFIESFQYFNIVYFFLGNIPLLAIGIYYTAQVKLSITPK